MDILPSGNIFRELQDIHDTGFFSSEPSLEDHWQQVKIIQSKKRDHFSNPKTPNPLTNISEPISSLYLG